MKIPLTIFLSFFSIALLAQKDTLFWFVVPEITKGQIGYDDPGLFHFLTFDAATTVTLSLPADPTFPVQQLTIPAASYGVMVMNNLVDLIENKPPGVVLSKGVMIRSSRPIIAYYETIGQLQTNPEIYVLKGNNALGTRFYTPFQTFLDNSDAHFPLPHAAFDIVATENNTSVTITPSRDIVAHNANIPFTLVMNRGQTYSCEATSQGAQQHPNGSLITSDKPIAVTIKDDLLVGSPIYEGFCRDQVGDQLIPVEYVGKRYVVQKGLLDGDERVVVIATQNGTQVRQNNMVVATLDAGMSATLLIDQGKHFITGSNPIYVFHISGIGCEVAAEIMPSLDCSGSDNVRFFRTNSKTFALFIVTNAGNESAFKVNGDAGVITASDFQVVPGSNGAFVAMMKVFPEFLIPSGNYTSVENTSGRFHLGFLNGQQLDGCSYGFFSDFQGKIVVPDTVRFCAGDTVQSHGLDIWEPGLYNVLTEHASGCDTLYRILAFLNPDISIQEVFEICPGSSIQVNGIEFSAPGVLIDTLPNTGPGCDTIRSISVVWAFSPEIEQLIAFCPGDTVHVGAQLYTAPFTYQDTLPASVGCDTIRTTIGSFFTESEPFLESDATLCPGELLVLRSPYPGTVWNNQVVSQEYVVTTTGLTTVYFPDANGCIQYDTVLVGTCCNQETIFIPNVFAPEGNTASNVFRIYATPSCILLRLQIYNRWGAMLFETNTPEEGWDGRFKGHYCEPGVYVWVLETAQSGTSIPEVLKGDVSIIR